MPITDEEAALQAIATLETLSADQQHALAAVNAILCDGQPFVDAHVLFAHYNVLYFRSLLLPRVELLWSPRLTLCAGICELSKDPSTGKLTRIRLKLSTPLLQYRPRSDTINTLLHEAIHAYFFITTSWQHSRGDDGTGHGVGFQLLADAINNHGNYDITIYHTFHDEVESFRTHVWKCNGPCSNMPPFFGLVKRSMNRAPGKSDTWWAKHQAECGGTYTKIKEPAPTKKQVEAMSAKERAGRQKNKLDKWIIPGTKQSEQEKSIGDLAEIQGGKSLPSAVQKKRKAQATEIQNPAKNEQPQQKKSRAENTDDVFFIEETTMVDCPICEARLVETLINQHLDAVHPASD